MATEAQKQLNLLDSGFLDNLGTSRGDLAMTETEKIFVETMGELVERLQYNLNTPGGDGREITASGALSESIHFEYSISGRGFHGEIYMADYNDFVDEGVRGIGADNRNTTSPYSFKHAFPSRKMQKALILWVREKSVISDVTAPKGLLGKHTRNYLRNKDRRNDLAIRLGMSILRRGTRATHFKEVGVDDILQRMTQKLAAALAVDVKVNIVTSLLK